MSSKPHILLNNVNADVTTPVEEYFEGQGGPCIAIVRGDAYGGGSVIVQHASKNDVNSAQGTDLRWVNLPNGSFTADGTVQIDYVPRGSFLRAVLNGSSGADNVYVEIQ